eukprot:scaffold1709_cov167-Alexandrium_tamarense.AAC.2
MHERLRWRKSVWRIGGELGCTIHHSVGLLYTGFLEHSLCQLMDDAARNDIAGKIQLVNLLGMMCVGRGCDCDRDGGVGGGLKSPRFQSHAIPNNSL